MHARLAPDIRARASIRTRGLVRGQGGGAGRSRAASRGDSTRAADILPVGDKEHPPRHPIQGPPGRDAWHLAEGTRRCQLRDPSRERRGRDALALPVDAFCKPDLGCRLLRGRDPARAPGFRGLRRASCDRKCRRCRHWRSARRAPPLPFASPHTGTCACCPGLPDANDRRRRALGERIALHRLAQGSHQCSGLLQASRDPGADRLRRRVRHHAHRGPDRTASHDRAAARRGHRFRRIANGERARRALSRPTVIPEEVRANPGQPV
jgi:hypothetical protein